MPLSLATLADDPQPTRYNARPIEDDYCRSSDRLPGTLQEYLHAEASYLKCYASNMTSFKANGKFEGEPLNE